MKIVCDACGAKYSIADEKVAGKVFKIRCKKCSNIIVVRGNAGEEAAAAPAEEPQPNKDTKVFDYAGYDSPQDAMAAEGDWHLVIDQEQVGPMTSDEVRQRFAAGEVDAESYIWKEGFADWERIPDVPEFADLGGAAPAAAATEPAAAGGMFGDMGDDQTAQANPSDLFGGGGGDSGGADLFGDAGASGGSDLFGGGAPVGENTGEVQMSAEAEAQLKGQRNENSVLFSLGNLAALASDSPKAAAPAASSSGGGSGGGSVANTGGSEGSGLIDIRSMANVYLADKKQPGISSTPTGSADDLPVFSQSAFESASPVLLPTQGGGTDKKLLYSLIGVIGVLGLAAIVLVVIVLKGGDDKGDPNAVAAADVTESDTDDESDDPDEPGSDEPGSDDPAEDPADSDPADTAETPTEPVAANTGTPDPAPKATGSSSRKPKSTSKKPKGGSSGRPKPPPPPPKEDTGKGGACDEVTCLVDPGKACCRKFNKSGGSKSSGSSSSSNSNLPEKPSRSDIPKGIGRVRGSVTSCGDKHGGKGTVKVKMKIGGDGKVKSAQASGGGSSLRSCVVSAVKRAKFKKTQKGMSVTYPFVFR
jgi:predicted Zn finger-like uncharacterized protein